MSYCRFFSGSDVYMYPHAGGFIVCSACQLENNDFSGDSPRFFTRTEALEHLREHEEAGHNVPDSAIQRLEREIEDIGEEIEPYEPDEENHG